MLKRRLFNVPDNRSTADEIVRVVDAALHMFFAAYAPASPETTPIRG
jgi:hypothetical protein